jgi:uncharacterized membrane protein YkvA (DUF1232 family)
MWQVILIILVILYIVNPYDILPDFLVGWGWLDDLVILGLLLRYVHTLKKKRAAFRQYYQNSRHSYDNGGSAYGKDNFRTNTNDRQSSSQWDPYRILGVERGASPETIKKAFRQMAGKYHPDKVEHLGEEFRVFAEKRFKEIQRAYEELKSK